jgi:hypothetical protein
MITMHRVTPLLFSACLLGVLAAPVAAQVEHRHSTITPEQIQKADALLREANDIVASCAMKNWKEAARLLVESAELRPCHDPQIFSSLHRAACLYEGSGDLRRAEETMEQAARHALYSGDVANAADSYIRLAWMAKERDDALAVHAYLARAQDLSYSPLLREAKAEEIRARITDHVGGGG